MNKRIYFVSDHHNFLGFEDYYNNLYHVIHDKPSLTIQLIKYHNIQEIPINDSGNIYVFFNQIPSQILQLIPSSRLMLINTEQLTRSHWHILIDIYSKHGIKIFDYDNYQSTVNNYEYLPYQVTDNEIHYLSKLLTHTVKNYDVAICSVNGSNRRASVVTRLRNMGISVIDVNGWGKSRDTQIASARILINIHYADNYQIFEHFRCDRWILSGMLIVSETSLSDPQFDCIDLIITSTYQDIVTTVIDVLCNCNKNGINMEKCTKIIENRRKYVDALIKLTA